MKAEVKPQHEWLAKLVGQRDYRMVHPVDEKGDVAELRGTETVRRIGSVWVVAEGHGLMPAGEPATMLLTLGFDPRKDRFVGTWIGSMMSHLWLYDGELDAAGKVLTLHSTGPSFDNPSATARYKDVIEIIGDNYRTFSGFAEQPGGEWRQLMTMHYHRRT